jgi:hypothetical protein
LILRDEGEKVGEEKEVEALKGFGLSQAISRQSQAIIRRSLIMADEGYNTDLPEPSAGGAEGLGRDWAIEWIVISDR